MQSRQWEWHEQKVAINMTVVTVYRADSLMCDYEYEEEKVFRLELF